MSILFHVRNDTQATGYTPLDIEELSDEQAAFVVGELHKTLKLFAIRPHLHWGLSIRAQNVLVRSGLITLWDLVGISTNQLVKLPGCGMRSMLEVYSAGRTHGIELPCWLKAVNSQYEVTFYNKRNKPQ